MRKFVMPRIPPQRVGIKPSIGKIRTTRMAARLLGLVGYGRFSFRQKESPGGFPELCMDLSECTVSRKAY